MHVQTCSISYVLFLSNAGMRALACAMCCRSALIDTAWSEWGRSMINGMRRHARVLKVTIVAMQSMILAAENPL